MFDLKILQITSLSLLAFTIGCGGSKPIEPVKLKMSDQELNETIHRYLSIYDNIDPNVVNKLALIVKRNASIFNYLTEAETDPEFLPYLEKYSNLKMQYKNQPIDIDVKVIFGTNPLKTSDHHKSMEFSGYCDFFTQVIFIDRDFWEAHQNNERVRESLLFHELGHCDLDRKHFLLHEDFSSYIQIENFSFMNGNIVYSLLINLLTQSEFKPNAIDEYDFYSRQIEEAKKELDHVFKLMYEELFSKENTRKNIICKDNGECIETFPDQISYGFETELIPILRHVTVGPSQGDNLQDIITYSTLQYVCYFYNKNNDKPLNDYLEEQDEITEEEIKQYCQLPF